LLFLLDCKGNIRFFVIQKKFKMIPHKAGYVSIIGKPNAGKSTLLNALLGEKLSIVSHKVQTTRHRILGLLNDNATQIIFSDTPGIIDPKYPLQKAMMNSVNASLIDADVLMVVTAMDEPIWEPELIAMVKTQAVKTMVVLSKVDLSEGDAVKERITFWEEQLSPGIVIPVSATKEFNLESILNYIREELPEHPPYFDKDDLSDRNIRFFVSEIIREKILLLYQKEIPYSIEVVVTGYEEGDDIDRIHAEVIVERESQKIIMIGKGAEMIKRTGTDARKDIEEFIGKKVFLDLRVKVIEGWRHKEQYLKRFGYE